MVHPFMPTKFKFLSSQSLELFEKVKKETVFIRSFFKKQNRFFGHLHYKT